MQRPHSHFQDLPGCTHFGKHACDAANPALPAFNELAARQLPGNCSNSLLLVNEANGFGTRGLGSRFSFYTACLAMAGSEGRIYIDKFCKGLDCDPSLVRPWTSCSEEDVAAAKRVGRAQVITNYVACFPFLHASPSPDMPLIVWWSAAFAFLMRPSVELSKTIDHELREFDGGRPAAGVHIRHCDKGLAEATLRPLADYMGLLQNHSHRPKTTQVRLITDDQAIYRALDQENERFPGFRFVRQDAHTVEKYRACAWACGERVRASHGVVRGGLHGSGSCYLAYQQRALVDLHVLARAPVGAFTWSSNYGMMFVSLQLFVNAFCSVALPVDNVQSGAGNSTIYLQRTEPRVDADLRTVTIVRASLVGRAPYPPLEPSRVAEIAWDARARTDLWSLGQGRVCPTGRLTSGARDRPFVRQRPLAAQAVTATSSSAPQASCTFLLYTPSELEQSWADNLERWMGNVCAHISESNVSAWLDSVHQLMDQEAAPMAVATETAALPAAILDNRALSAFTYRRTVASRVDYVHVPIEPLAGVMRDPRKCWQPRTERYTQSKGYLLPLSHQAATGAGACPAPRAFLFDAGATIPTTVALSIGRHNGTFSGTSWLFDWYKWRGIVFDHVHAWDPNPRGELVLSAVDPKFAAALNFYPRGVSADPASADNPLALIRRMCTPEDLVVFKLDIDTTNIELQLTRMLLGDSQLLGLVDEFFFEHHIHFASNVMAMHGMGRRTMNKGNNLKSWVEMALPARRKGLRMHYWP